MYVLRPTHKKLVRCSMRCRRWRRSTIASCSASPSARAHRRPIRVGSRQLCYAYRSARRIQDSSGQPESSHEKPVCQTQCSQLVRVCKPDCSRAAPRLVKLGSKRFTPLRCDVFCRSKCGSKCGQAYMTLLCCCSSHAPTASISALVGSTCGNSYGGRTANQRGRRCCATRTAPSCSSS